VEGGGSKGQMSTQKWSGRLIGKCEMGIVSGYANNLKLVVRMMRTSKKNKDVKCYVYYSLLAHLDDTLP
jgi:hypothetical protein